MGTLAVAGCVWSASGDLCYGGKWAWLVGRSRSTEFSVGVAGGPWSLHSKQLGATGGARRLGAF